MFTKRFSCFRLKDIIAQGLDVQSLGPDCLDLYLISCMTLVVFLTSLCIHCSFIKCGIPLFSAWNLIPLWPSRIRHSWAWHFSILFSNRLLLVYKNLLVFVYLLCILLTYWPPLFSSLSVNCLGLSRQTIISANNLTSPCPIFTHITPCYNMMTVMKFHLKVIGVWAKQLWEGWTQKQLRCCYVIWRPGLKVAEKDKRGLTGETQILITTVDVH